MENVKVIIWGFGAMGRGMASMLLKKKGVEIVGVCDINEAYHNRSFLDVLNEESENKDVKILNDIDEVLKVKADICLLATDSFVKGAYDKIVKLLNHKLNVISTAEEMAYPSASEKELSDKINQLAKKQGVTVLGTGINPGFIMDLLVVALTGAMAEVSHIEAKRINSLSPFGPTVMTEQGVGISIEAFEQGVRENKIAGHVGFNESIHMIADALGVKLTDFKQQMSPIVTDVDRVSPFGSAKKGSLAGINMTGQGLIGNDVFINMIHPQQIEPEQVGIETGDYITLKGYPNIHMQIKPEISGGIGTIAMCCNMIPHVINSKPGLKTMIDLPVPRAILGDMRELIEEA